MKHLFTTSRIRKSLTVCAFMIFAQVSVTAADYYVSSSGNDATGNGSYSAPFATISKAYTTMAANSSGEIRVLSDLTVAATSFAINKTVTITSYSDETTAATTPYMLKRSASDVNIFIITAGAITFTNIVVDGQGNIARDANDIDITTYTASGGSFTSNTKALVKITSGSLTLGNKAYLQNNKASIEPGGIFLQSVSTGNEGTVNLLPGSGVWYNSGGSYNAVDLGGSPTTAGGIAVNGKKARFYMSGGTVAFNTASTWAGGIGFIAIDQTHPEYYLISGGLIAYNYAPQMGGGVLLDTSASITMTGGTIENNTNNGQGGAGVGIWGSECRLLLGGGNAITIKNNKTASAENNVLLQSNQTVTLTSALTAGSKIGINLGTMPTSSTKIKDIATGATAANGYSGTADENKATAQSFFSSDKSTTAGINWVSDKIVLSFDDADSSTKAAIDAWFTANNITGITATDTDANTITVTGTASQAATTMLDLTIPAGVTVNWQATLTSSADKVISINTASGTGSVFDMTGGVVTSAGCTSLSSHVIYNSSSNAAIMISGGTINGGGNSSYFSYGVYNSSTGSVTVSDGTINGGAGSTRSLGIYNNSTGSIIVSGGTVNSGSGTTNYGIYNNSTGHITVSGGEVNGGNSCIYENASGGTMTISGGKIMNGKNRAIIATAETNLTVNGSALVFGKGVPSTIQGATVTPTGEAIIITWTGIGASYTKDATTDLTVLPATGATAVWDLVDGKSGITYTNGANTGFFEVLGVTVDGTGTGINNANADNPIIRTEYYDINGKKLNTKPAKGFYIENNFHENGARASRTMGAF